MNRELQSADGLLVQDLHVNVAAMATMVRALVKHNGATVWDTGVLHERMNALGLKEHERGALSMLHRNIATTGSGFLDSFFSKGW